MLKIYIKIIGMILFLIAFVHNTDASISPEVGPSYGGGVTTGGLVDPDMQYSFMFSIIGKIAFVVYSLAGIFGLYGLYLIIKFKKDKVKSRKGIKYLKYSLYSFVLTFIFMNAIQFFVSYFLI